jgi:hypothetical protein
MVREARATETAAGDQLEAAQAALHRLEAKTDDLESDHRDAEVRIAAAANRVLALQFGAAMDRAKALQAELGAVRAVLHFLSRSDRLDPVDKKAAADFFAAAPFPHEYGTQPAPHPIATEWDACFRALICDAATPLPAVFVNSSAALSVQPAESAPHGRNPVTPAAGESAPRPLASSKVSKRMARSAPSSQVVRQQKQQ